jgi:UDP-2,4-diacetamido-2,4,6-trideoxy-beta-L-altropyranose hydrolase
MRRVILRADAGSEIGLGHVVRCLSLVDMLKDQFRCLFIISNPATAVIEMIQRITEVHVIHHDTLNGEITSLRKLINKEDIVVTDGYHFDTPYQQFIKSVACKLVMIDDKADMHYYADLIINHGNDSMINRYKKEPYSKVLAGFRYLLVRKEFLEAAISGRSITTIHTAFICMGGADPFNITIKVLKACFQTDFLKRVIIVTGSAYRNHQQLQDCISQHRKYNKDILHESNISGERIIELISMSQIAIAPASSIALEICCVKAGLLSGIVIDNQEAIHAQLLASGCCISSSDFVSASIEEVKRHLDDLNDCKKINEMVNRQSLAIDGLSGMRIRKEFQMMTAC